MRLPSVLALALLAGCSRGPRPPEIYASAERLLRAGDLTQALALAEEGAAAASDPSLHRAFRLLAAELHLMRRELPQAATILAERIEDTPDRPRLDARREYLLGYQHVARGNLRDAATTLETAIASANAHGAADVALTAEALLGQLLYRASGRDDADQRLLGALNRARQTTPRHDDAVLLLTLGMGRLSTDRFDEALSYFDPILEFDELSADLVYATALSNAGICHARLGDFDKAIALQTRAVALHEARNVRRYVAQSLGELGNTFQLKGEPAKAVIYLERARDVATSAELGAEAALWTNNLALARIALAQWDAAERLNESAIEMKRAAGDTSLVYNIVYRAMIAAGRGQFPAAVAGFSATLADASAPVSLQWLARGGLAQALFDSGERDKGLDEFERALALIESTRADLLRAEYRFSFLSALMEFHQAYIDALLTMGEPERALEIADFSRGRVLAERIGGAATRRASARELMRHAARTRTTMVAYWLGPRQSSVWTVTGTRVTHHALPPAPAIASLVARHRQFVERSLADPLATAHTPGDELVAAVLAPVRNDVGDRPGRIVLVPDGALHGVNFETLPVGTPRHYLIDDMTIVIAPSLALAMAPQPARAATASSLLLIGDAVAEAGGKPPLQFAGAELDTVARALPNARRLTHRGATAQPSAYLNAMPSQFSVIHFAAHATASATSPLESAIELSAEPPGSSKLYARDIAAIPLNADLVTIAACRGVGDRAYSGEGPVGLAWAFLRAGASRVIAGLWDVDDRSTSDLMAGLYADLARGVAPADALRAAKLSLIRKGGTYAKPYYWGALQIYGGRF